MNGPPENGRCKDNEFLMSAFIGYTRFNTTGYKFRKPTLQRIFYAYHRRDAPAHGPASWLTETHSRKLSALPLTPLFPRDQTSHRKRCWAFCWRLKIGMFLQRVTVVWLSASNDWTCLTWRLFGDYYLFATPTSACVTFPPLAWHTAQTVVFVTSRSRDWANTCSRKSESSKSTNPYLRSKGWNCRISFSHLTGGLASFGVRAL